MTEAVRVMQVPSIPVAVYGLGPMGAEIVRVIASKPWLRLIAAIDHDAGKLGREVAEVVRLPQPLGVVVTDQITARPEVICHSTGSTLAQVEQQLRQLLSGGSHVISTCEELAFPLDSAIRTELQKAARAANVTLLGTGVNPGFVMDKLPLTLTAVCQEISSIEVHRVVNASLRREPLQRKIGAGLTREEFASAIADGKIRHIGLRQSLALIADGLNLELDHIDDELIEPVITGTRLRSDVMDIPSGRVAGIHQRIRGERRGVTEIVLDLRVYVGAEHAGDRIEIRGVPDISVSIAGGIHGDRATAAMVVNAIPRVIAARPGVLTMDDIPISHR